MINEYELLITENNELKQKIILLENNIIINENIKIKEQLKFNENTILYLHTDMINKNVEINNLKLENKELKQKILNLENKINIFETENKIIKEDTRIIKEENKQLKIDNIKLNKKIDDLEKNAKISKIKLALQDINSLESLEIKLFKIKKFLKKLRIGRNGECHYLIKSEDSQELINLKKIYLLEKLIDFKHKDIFDIEYTVGFIDEYIQYLKNNTIQSTDISEDDLETFEIFKNIWDDVFILE